MSKIVKKMKIMQPGGTLSDYVPIGAEAENINVDGESVETKLDKKPYYYDTVADMKADTKLKAGDMVVTLGYYSINDGGDAEYLITNTVSQTEYQEEVGSLYATLIIKDYTTPEMFGAKGDGVTDDTAAITNCFSYSKNIIANNVYQCSFSDTTINNSFALKGNGTFYLNSIIFNQKVILEGIKFLYTNIGIDGIIIRGNSSYISNCIFDGQSLKDKNNLIAIDGNDTVVDNSVIKNNSTGRAGLIANSVNNCVVKNCYFENIGETALSFKYHCTNCIADGNIAKDCSIIGALTDSVFSTYGDYETGEYAKNIGFINNVVLGNDVKYCFRFDGTESGYAKNNYIDIGNCLKVFMVGDRIDHDIKLYAKNIDICNNIVNVNSTTSGDIIIIRGTRDGLRVNIKGNIVKAVDGTGTWHFVDMAQTALFTGDINIEDNEVEVSNATIACDVSTLMSVNYNILNNRFKYRYRTVLVTAGKVNMTNNYLESIYSKMVYLKNCSYIIINNTLVNNTVSPEISNMGNTTALTPLSNTLIDLSSNSSI